jgi:hypothetical protein
VSEFRKYSQGGERNEPKFATLRAKCGEIRSEKFGRFVSERTVAENATKAQQKVRPKANIWAEVADSAT